MPKLIPPNKLLWHVSVLWTMVKANESTSALSCLFRARNWICRENSLRRLHGDPVDPLTHKTSAFTGKNEFCVHSRKNFRERFRERVPGLKFAFCMFCAV